MDNQTASIFSDLWKDCYGVRPRFDTSSWTEEEWKKQFDSLQEQLNQEIAIEKEQKKQNIIDFEDMINKRIEISSCMMRKTRQTIIDEMVSEDCNGDSEYLEYKHGLPYGYLKSI